jgi:hypothetical protein
MNQKLHPYQNSMWFVEYSFNMLLKRVMRGYIFYYFFIGERGVGWLSYSVESNLIDFFYIFNAPQVIMGKKWRVRQLQIVDLMSFDIYCFLFLTLFSRTQDVEGRSCTEPLYLGFVVGVLQ